MGQISLNPCLTVAPEITATYACGGVVTLSASPVSKSTSYSWNLGNGSTATGPGPITTTYPGAGPYTVTLTTSFTKGTTSCQNTTTETVTPNQGGGCCPSGIAASNLLGSAGTTTTLPPGTYSGTYRVLGDLLLTNGSYTLSNATFYVDGAASKTPVAGGGYQRTVSGSTITLGANATLMLDNSTLTASGGTTGCPMWRGLVVNSNGQGPGGTYRLVVQNNSIISHAQCAINMEDITTTGTTAYLLDQSTFSHNLTHVRDESYHTGTQPSLITSCTFESEALQMHLPYDQTTAYDAYYTYEALVVRPLGGNPGAVQAVEVRGNTIYQAVYGIVNNQFDRAGVLIQNNILNKILLTGIWTVNNNTNGGTSTPVVSNNYVGINAYPSRDTDQVDPTATVFGIVGEDTRLPNAFIGNHIVGDKNNNTQPEIGLSISLQTDASGNSLDNLNEGIRTTALDGSSIVDNHTSNCDDAFVVQPSPNGMYYLNHLGCNTFSQPSPAPTSRGIVVQQDATINDIGDFSNPAANRFDGVGMSIYNDGSPFTYYRTNSSQEPVGTFGGGITSVQTVIIPRSSLVDYCLNRGANNNNGVNQARGTAASLSYIAALMDSVRLQLVPTVRRQRYLAEVLSYHSNTQQLPALETWWLTLALSNATAYRTAGLYLLRAYDQQPATAVAAQRVLAGLQSAALLNAELAAQLQLRTMLRHLSQTTPRLVAADSIVLRTLAWSSTSVATSAGRWLRYYHPRIPLPAPVSVLRLMAKRKRALTESGASLGAAYPNPAQTEVIITCQLVQAGQVAELHFTNLLTGQVARVVPVEGTARERSQRVALDGLPAGQYAYQLVVEGQLVATPQRLTVNP